MNESTKTLVFPQQTDNLPRLAPAVRRLVQRQRQVVEGQRSEQLARDLHAAIARLDALYQRLA